MASPFLELFQPIRLGPMEVKNRLVMSSTERRCGEVCWEPGISSGLHEGLIATYAARARGGVGLVILEDTDVDSRTGLVDGFETSSPMYPCLDRDMFIPAFKDFTDAIHVYGAKVAPNLRHLGMIAIPKGGARPLTASGAENPISKSPYGHKAGPDAKTATLEEIRYVQEQFAAAAYRAKRAKFDAVQIAGHHGFIISQFLSPRTNRRTDQYGGSLDNRMRFAVELVRLVRERIGPTMALIFALSADELIEGGLGIEESKIIAQALEAEGVDAFHVVPGIIFPFPWGHRSIPTMGEPHAPFANIAQQIKDAVKVPVIANGRIKDPHKALEIVHRGQADMVSMARALAADPDWPVKVLRGDLESIRPCIGCNFCVDSVQAKLSSRCSVNADWGRERTPWQRTLSPRTVVVIGGGAAGLEAARVAALRGHAVHLFEKEKRLGGQLALASTPPGKGEIAQFQQYLVSAVSRLPVTVHLGEKADAPAIEKLSPDVVIIATGAYPVVPGNSSKATVPMLSAWQALETEVPGGRVVVVGGGATGCEVAEHLASKGKQVTIVEMLPELARDMNPLGEGMRYFLLERLDRLKVAALLNTRFLEVRGGDVVAAGKHGEQLVPADAVVLSMGAKSRVEIDAVDLQQRVPEVYIVGDALKPRTILDAVWEGSSIARTI